VARGMRCLMSEDGVKAFAVAKRLQLRHLHEVAGRTVKGAAAAVLNGDFRVGEKPLYGVQWLA
jgi:hypothetical protein